MDEQQLSQYMAETPGIDFRTTQIMLMDELLDILYNNDEILIPGDKVTQLQLNDLASIVVANRSQVLPTVNHPDEHGALSELFTLMNSGTFMQLLNEQIERILPENSAAIQKIKGDTTSDADASKT